MEIDLLPSRFVVFGHISLCWPIPTVPCSMPNSSVHFEGTVHEEPIFGLELILLIISLTISGCEIYIGELLGDTSRRYARVEALWDNGPYGEFQFSPINHSIEQSDRGE